MKTDELKQERDKFSRQKKKSLLAQQQKPDCGNSNTPFTNQLRTSGKQKGYLHLKL